MRKWFKLGLGLLLLPTCLAATQALVEVIRGSGRADRFWFATLAGAGCWLSIHWLLPRPMRIYVFGHELTHALWTWLLWGKVTRFKVASRGGSVVTNRPNFLVTLAPYFFPLYAVGVVVGFAIGNSIWGWEDFSAAFCLLLGAAYAFHVTLNCEVLRTRQTDITSQGYLFSAAIIWLGNVFVLLLGIPLLTMQTKVSAGFIRSWELTLGLWASIAKLSWLREST